MISEMSEFYPYTIDDIKNGDVEPVICFKYKGPVLDINTHFNFPISNLTKRNGNWDINGSKVISDLDLEVFKQLIHSHYDEVYYMQEGKENWVVDESFRHGSENGWFILAKIKDYYIYLDAYDFTGFGAQCGGTFAYSTDWKTLWNKYITDDFRNIILRANDYDHNLFDINLNRLRAKY